MQLFPHLQAAINAIPASADRRHARTQHATADTAHHKAPRTHMPALDGLRGLAALAVVMAHLPTKTPFWERVNFGEGGVFLFFVLSGFLMTHLHLRQALEPASLRRFCVARVARIVPMYYLVVCVSFVVTQLWHPEFQYSMGTVQFLRHLGFTGSVGVFWSVGPEFQFYGFFVLLWALPMLRGQMRVLGLVFLAGFALACYAASPRLPGVLFVSKLHIFLGGMAVAMLRWRMEEAGASTSRVTPGVLQVIACLAVLMLLAPYPHMLLPVFAHDDVRDLSLWYYSDLPRVALAGLVVLACSLSTPASNALLGNRLARLLGRASFSIYLLHMPVMDLMRGVGLFDRLNPWIASIGCIVLVVLVSLLANRWIEIPAQRWVVRRFDGRAERRLAPQT